MCYGMCDGSSSWCRVRAIVVCGTSKHVVEVIVIEESPRPTKSFSTPRATPMRPRPRSPRSAVRAGASRVCAHRRKLTCVFDPPSKGHCANQALLCAANTSTCMMKVRELRQKVSKIIVDAYEKDLKPNGISVRHMVARRGVSIEQYAKEITLCQWASPLEVHYAAVCLEIKVNIVTKTSCMTCGQGRFRGVLKYAKHHFVLNKTHGKAPGKAQRIARELVRGGMRVHQTPEEEDS